MTTIAKTRSAFVGVDPSTANTAAVAIDHAGKVLGVFESAIAAPPDKLRTAKAGILHKLAIGEELSEFISSLPKCDYFIAYEDYSFNSINKAFTIGELGGILKAALYEYTNDVVYVPPKTLKRFATGHGGSDKEVLAQAAREAVPVIFDKSSLDVTDAYWLARVALAYYAPKAAVAAESHTALVRLRMSEVKKLKSRKRSE